MELECLLFVLLSTVVFTGAVQTQDQLGRKLKSTVEILQYFLLFVLLSTVVPTGVIHAQDQSGFISLDCGLPDNGSYVDSVTGLNYSSDEAFTNNGTSKSISSEYNGSVARPLDYVRSFPEGERNCYKVNVTRGSKYLIRARLMYGNYDGLNRTPEFDLYVGPIKWVTVQLERVDAATYYEIIHDVATRNYVVVCLVNTGLGTPFISALELRPLNNKSYDTQFGSLRLYSRLDYGSITNEDIRYPHDIYDRIWTAVPVFEPTTGINTSQDIDHNLQGSNFKPPSRVMQTAIKPTNPDGPLSLIVDKQSGTIKLYTYMHFAEIENLRANQSREFNIYWNGETWYEEAVKLSNYLSSNTIYSTTPQEVENKFSLAKTNVSTLPPLINAIEIYHVLDHSLSKQQDVDAMVNIKSAYRIAKNWQGDDPCNADFLWEGLNCSYSDYDLSRIISL